MRQALIRVQGEPAAILSEIEPSKRYRLVYLSGYKGVAIGQLLPVRTEPYEWPHFPPWFDNMLQEGARLELACRLFHVDPRDRMGLLLKTCGDAIGHVTAIPYPE